MTDQNGKNRKLLSGDEAVALAALDAGVALASAYPGTPSTEIMEAIAKLGGPAQWAPNEKVAFEVALGAAFGGVRALVAMKHVGVNVAADPLFTATYTGVAGALVLISCDDPGMASSQNEQDNRRYAVAAGIPMLEPSDSQEAYDFLFAAFEMSERWKMPVMLRMTTRVCHSQSIVLPRAEKLAPLTPGFERDIRARVMIPGFARPAHRRLRAKLAEMEAWGEAAPLNQRVEGKSELGIITAGVCYVHAREASPEASVLKLGLTYPLPMGLIKEFAQSVKRCVVLEENDPYMVDAIRAAGVVVEGKAEMYRFGELSVDRVKRILACDESPEAPLPTGKPPQLCVGCPHRVALSTLRKLDCIVVGDIGCYTLGVLSPIDALDTCVCMGASIGNGLGLRHVLPADQARRVVSVIGDSTFVHSGITGLVEMAYNPPPTGHVVLILDNGTTAMTGLQDHPGTGYRLNEKSTGKLVFEDLARSLGITNIHVFTSFDPQAFESLVKESLASEELVLIIARRPCILAAKKLKERQSAPAEKTNA